MVCSNCSFQETQDAKFCSSCGQQFGPAKLTIKEFIKDLIDHVFNLDTSFFRTIGRIFIPGQLTLDYFNGYRKRYYHPLRLFFVLLVIHLGVLGGLIPFDIIFNQISKQTNKIQTQNLVKSELEHFAANSKDKASRLAVDSIKSWFEIGQDTSAKTANNLNGNLSVFGRTNIPLSDIILLSNDSLASKYDLPNYWLKLGYRQVQKFLLDPKAMIRYVLGNISWMMIIMVPMIALFMKLLFRRKSRFYIEHLFYLYHWHAVAFLLGTLLVFFMRNYIQYYVVPYFGLIILFGIIAWKRYYQQGWLKTLFKFMAMGFAYLMLFAFFLSLTMVISFGFF
ncbi:MAG: DUF3667 domain-containing protein [Saprospiraceae bacterium]|nr:DUF3667 domain-containing protein [Saprospiraceae bacterium]